MEWYWGEVFKRDRSKCKGPVIWDTSVLEKHLESQVDEGFQTECDGRIQQRTGYKKNDLASRRIFILF